MDFWGTHWQDRDTQVQRMLHNMGPWKMKSFCSPAMLQDFSLLLFAIDCINIVLHGKENLNCKWTQSEICRPVCHRKCRSAALGIYQQTARLQERSNHLFCILFNLFLFHRNFTVNKWRVCVCAATPSVLWQLNAKCDCQFTEGSDCCYLIPLLLLKEVAGLKEASDNKENNNIYLFIHSLYISWYNSDILLLAKLL